jgi:hypothetical protein
MILGHGYNVFVFDGRPVNLSSSKARFMFLLPVSEGAKPWKN